MSKKLKTLSIIMALALVLVSGGYFSTQAGGFSFGCPCPRDTDKAAAEPMKVYQHTGMTDGSDYGRPFGNTYGTDNAKNSMPTR